MGTDTNSTTDTGTNIGTATETCTVTNTKSATDTYTATDKVVNTVTDNATNIEMDTNSAEGMFTNIGGHCIITSRLRVGGFFENVTKRDGGGWVGWAERDVTLILRMRWLADSGGPICDNRDLATIRSEDLIQEEVGAK